MFRSLVLLACLIGVILGLSTTAMQAVGVTPIILSAEQYEVGDDLAASHEHSHSQESASGHHHDKETWAPEDGAERIFSTAIANIGAGIGFSAIMLVVMNQLHEYGRLKLTPVSGLAMGALFYIAVFVVPSLGLPPEIPGASAAAVESRQLWWFTTVALAAVGLGLLFLADAWKRVLGLPFLLLPFAWVPAHEGPMFTHPDPEAVTALTELHRDFIWASGITNMVFWLLAGLLCALFLKRLAASLGRQGDVAAC